MENSEIVFYDEKQEENNVDTEEEMQISIIKVDVDFTEDNPNNNGFYE